MATEDFTTYTEVDASGKLTVTASRVTATNLPRNVDAYVYKDFGENYFANNIVIEATISVSYVGTSGYLGLIVLSNDLDDLSGLTSASKNCVGFLSYEKSSTEWWPSIIWRSGPDGSATQWILYYGPNTYSYGTYYISMQRISGIWTLEIYSDSSRTNLVARLSTNPIFVTNWRYLMVGVSFNTGNTYLASGYIENLNIAGYSLSADGVTAAAKFSDGAIATLVKAHRVDTEEFVGSAVPNASTGAFTISPVPRFDCLVTACKSGYRPLTHGPVSPIAN